MDVDALPPADALWWSFAVRTALAVAGQDETWAFDPIHQMLRHDGNDSQLRMQRLYGGRAVLWGASGAGAGQRRSWTGIPGWATSDAVRDWLVGSGTTFVAWHSRDGWDTATPEADLAPALAPLLAEPAPDDLVEAARRGKVERQLLEGLVDDPATALHLLHAAGGEAPPVQGMVRSLLAAEIRAQMRLTPERERMLPQRPVLLVRWSRVASPPRGFTHAVHQCGPGQLAPALGNSALAPQFRLTLDNVLARLHLEEADESSGSWLFARVRHDGVNVHLDRAFDSRPAWFEDDGPTLDDLATEMSRRTPGWRPAWTRLLP